MPVSSPFAIDMAVSQCPSLSIIRIVSHLSSYLRSLFLFFFRNTDSKKNQFISNAEALAMPDTRQNRVLAEMAFEPIEVDTGTYYPCYEEDLAAYRRFPSPNRQRLVSAIEATNEIVHRNTELRRREDFDRDEWAAMERLTSGVNKAARSRYTPDLIIKMFADLDLVFFNGRLLGNVIIKWHVIGPRIFGDTGPKRVNQAGIRLNPDEIFIRSDNAFQRMFGTMLHEMCVSIQT